MNTPLPKVPNVPHVRLCGLTGKRNRFRRLAKVRCQTVRVHGNEYAHQALSQFEAEDVLVKGDICRLDKVRVYRPSGELICIARQVVTVESVITTGDLVRMRQARDEAREKLRLARLAVATAGVLARRPAPTAAGQEGAAQ